MNTITKRKNVLSVNADNKTVKGLKLGYLTGILYLAPYTIAGKNICPNAENASCHKACLYTAGRGLFSNVQKARIAKTERFHNDFENFFQDIMHSINIVIRKAKRENLAPCIRLNGTSDINWQSLKFEGKTIFEYFPDIQFYDYTKVPQKVNFDNYHLTFSYSAASKAYKKSILKALDLAMNIAVVFSDKNIPNHFLGYPVVSGDDTDLRFLDATKHVIGLYAKGAAKLDKSGFVVNTNLIPTF